MSLKVWLPLNGNLDNIGTDRSIQVTNSGAIVNDNGKIGKCYNFGTSTSYLAIPKEAMNTFSTECSVTFWLKIISWNTNYATFFQAGTGSTPWNNYIFGFLRNNNGSTACFTISNGSSASNASYLTSTLELNKWYHIALTYSTGKCKIYLNGILDHEYNTSIVPNFSAITTITTGIANNKSGYQTNCQINDLRIYDHCLSALEVKEISQGLILHYKLDNVESSQNLMTTEDCFDGATCYNGATSKYGYGTNTDMYKTTGVFQGRKSTKVYMGTDGLNAYPYVYFNPFSAVGTTVHTLSFDYFPTSQNKLIPYSYNGAYDWTYTVNGVVGSATNATTCPTLTVNLNQWNHIEITARKTDTTNASRGIGYIRIGSAKHTSTTTDYWLFANVQVEEKDHATPYMGVGGSREEKVVDSSGYGHNGIAVNSPSIVTDSKSRYGICTKFNGSNTYINAGIGAKVKDAITIAWWGYMDTWSSYQRAISCTEGGGWNFEPSSGKLNFAMGTGASSNTYKSCTSNTTLASLSAGWHHFVGTYDGLISNLYIDGVLDKTLNCYTTKTPIYYHASNSILVGAEVGGAATAAGNYYNGKLSDIRIYATALSAEDITTLYNTPAHIDKLGSIHGFELVENGAKQSINKKGQIINNSSSKTYLINNFAETNTMDEWSFGGSPTISNGVVTMTGINPSVSSNNFTVNPDDIIVIEFGLEMPIISTGTSGPGIFLGTPTGSANSATRYQYNFTTRTWTTANTNDTNPYFMYAYNSTDYYHCRTYLLGSNKTIDDLPPAEASDSSRTLYALKLNSATTSKIRSGYNTNTTMTIKLNDFKIYKLDNEGFCEGKDTAKVGVGYYQTKNFIEK